MRTSKMPNPDPGSDMLDGLASALIFRARLRMLAHVCAPYSQDCKIERPMLLQYRQSFSVSPSVPYRRCAGALPLLFIIVVFFLVPSGIHAQVPATQKPRVGLVFFDFLDRDTNPDAKGGVGYGRGAGYEFKKNRKKIDPKYRVKDYYDLFFKEEGWIAHPDSFSHGARYTGMYKMGMKGSLRTWVRENSYGVHDVIPYSGFGGYPGILNTVRPDGNDTSLADGYVNWITITAPKSFFFTNPDKYRPFYYLQAESEAVLDHEFDIGGNRWWRTELDIVFVIVAGANIPNMQTFAGLEADYRTPRRPIMVFVPEKSSNISDPDNPAESILQYFETSLAHEYLHAAGFFIKTPLWDINQPHNEGSKYIGEYSSYYQRQQCPPHLDPWRKLQLGWIDWQMVTGTVKNMPLPAVCRCYDGGMPRVAVIPLDVPKGWTDVPDWKKGHYLIVENRRSDGFDEFTLADQNGYEMYSKSLGGFTVWEFTDSLLKNEDDGIDGLSMIEADGGHHLDLGQYLPREEDFFSVPQTVTMWTDPDFIGVESFSWKGDGDIYARMSGLQLTIRFGDYAATRDFVNSVPLIEFGVPAANNSRALEGNNQRKIASSGRNACLVQTVTMDDPAKGLVFAHVSTDGGKSWGRTYMMNRMRLKKSWIVDKTPMYAANAPSVAFFPSMSGGDDAFHVVWQEYDNSAYKIRTAVPGGQAVDITTVPAFAPLTGSPTPVIWWRNGTADVVFASVSGLMESFSTDFGKTWTQPVPVQGTTAYSMNPAVAANSVHDVLVYQDRGGNGRAQLFCSIDGAVPVDLSTVLPQALSNETPSIDINGNTAHLAWIATIEEVVGGTTIQRRRTCHARWSLDQPLTSMVITRLDADVSTTDVPANPVVAGIQAGSSDEDAGVMWSIRRADGSAVLHHNSHQAGLWNSSDSESPIRDSVSVYPAMFTFNGSPRYCVSTGNTIPMKYTTRGFKDDGDSLTGGGKQETFAARMDDTKSMLSLSAGTSAESQQNPEAVAQLRAWPQPARATVQFSVPAEFRTGAIEVVLYNSLGVRVREMTTDAAGAGVRARSIDLAGLPSGLYLLTLKSGDAVLSSRVAVAR